MKKIEMFLCRLNPMSRVVGVVILGVLCLYGSLTMAAAAADDERVPMLQAITMEPSAFDQNPPEITLIYAVDVPLLDPRGFEYFLEDDLVLPIVSAFDPDHGQVPFELELNGEPFTLGTQIEGKGEYSLVAIARDDTGRPWSKTWVIHIRDSVEFECTAMAEREYLPKTGEWSYVVQLTSEDFLPAAVEPRYLSLIIAYPVDSGQDDQRVMIDGLYPEGSLEPVYENGQFTLDDTSFMARFTVPAMPVEPEWVFVHGESLSDGLDFDLFERVVIVRGGLATDLGTIGEQPRGWSPPNPGGRPCGSSMKNIKAEPMVDVQKDPLSGTNRNCPAFARHIDRFDINHFSVLDHAEGHASCEDNGGPVSEIRTYSLAGEEEDGATRESLQSTKARVITMTGDCISPNCEDPYVIRIILDRKLRVRAGIYFEEETGAGAGAVGILETVLNMTGSGVYQDRLHGAIKLEGSNLGSQTWGLGLTLRLFPPGVGVTGSVTFPSGGDSPDEIGPIERPASNRRTVDTTSRLTFVRTYAYSSISVLADGHCPQGTQWHTRRANAKAESDTYGWSYAVSHTLIVPEDNECFIEIDHP